MAVPEFRFDGEDPGRSDDDMIHMVWTCGEIVEHVISVGKIRKKIRYALLAPGADKVALDALYAADHKRAACAKRRG